MRKGFSLIEIIQTIILIGIVAGLAISFLKVVDRDIEIYYATEKHLVNAIEEAGRQMCADTSFYCSKEDCTIDPANYCVGLASATMQNDDGFCYIARLTAGNNDGCPAGYAENSRGECYRNPVCIDVDKNVCTDTVDGEVKIIEAGYLSDDVCANVIPRYNRSRTISFKNGASVENITSASELCFRLHGLLSHKAQNRTASLDFNETCGADVRTPHFRGLNTTGYATIEQIKNHVKTIMNTETNILSDRVNLILPNGLRVYGLNHYFVQIGPTASAIYIKDIFVKFDRVEKVDSMVICDSDGIKERDCNTMVIRITLDTNGNLSSIINLSSGASL